MGETPVDVSPGPAPTGEAVPTQQEGPTAEGQAARIGELIMRIFLHIRQRLRTLSAEDTAANSLSVTETLVLWTISTSGPMKFHSLSRQVGIPVSTLTTMVDRMEARGFLRRRPDRDDRRAIFVEGTPDLARIKERHTALIRHEMESVVALLAPEQVRETLRGLEHMARALADVVRPPLRPETGCMAEGASDPTAGGDGRQTERPAPHGRAPAGTGKDGR